MSTDEGGETPVISAEWDKTIFAIQRLKQEGVYEEPDSESRRGYFLGRAIIGRDTPINGGIYVGGGKREAIVVDDRDQSSPLHTIYSELLQMRNSAVRKGGSYRGSLLSDVFDLVRKKLPYDKQGTVKLAKELGIGPDQPVSLDEYLKEKVGVCRHQALLTAYLLERLKKESRVRGNVSIDRNYVPGMGGHAWVRYVNSVGEVFILDPANNLADKLGNLGSGLKSFYERPSGFSSQPSGR